MGDSLLFGITDAEIRFFKTLEGMNPQKIFRFSGFSELSEYHSAFMANPK
jgi:hypothetical protein